MCLRGQVRLLFRLHLGRSELQIKNDWMRKKIVIIAERELTARTGESRRR